jgi:hypothetical protein
LNLRSVAAVAGVLGGLVWVARLVLDLAGVSDTILDPLYLLGGLLLVVAYIGFGAGLVGRSAHWLQAIVGLCFPALVWSVLEMLRADDPELVDGIFGAGTVVASVLVLARERRRRPPPRRAGAHAR